MEWLWLIPVYLVTGPVLMAVGFWRDRHSPDRPSWCDFVSVAVASMVVWPLILWVVCDEGVD